MAKRRKTNFSVQEVIDEIFADSDSDYVATSSSNSDDSSDDSELCCDENDVEFSSDDTVVVGNSRNNSPDAGIIFVFSCSKY